MTSRIYSWILLFTGALTITACAPMTETPVPSAGKVYNGEYAGTPFIMATDNSVNVVEQFIQAYNDMNVEKMSSFMADTVIVYDYTGARAELTKTALEEYMAGMDSVRQDIYATIPVMLENGDRVSVLVDSQEWRWGTDGSEWRKRLWERIIVDDGKIVGVRQWSRDVGGM